MVLPWRGAVPSTDFQVPSWGGGICSHDLRCHIIHKKPNEIRSCGRGRRATSYPGPPGWLSGDTVTPPSFGPEDVRLTRGGEIATTR